ncbi:DUF2339 domain-containing protein [Qipengyuania gelatinilytica]|uniref:DUF2339 domain-containing protein n=1 Tax=Qipengyuania gelatinilytica TaxID=2867231 RepID=A0ABX9A053_9SPHN|nr:DUF2339 domain-containing protein [Qipengyuania gelatinilytica]QZD94650.1 DUF2339 domain-containing protein [Qipengyuania gelatinilytica]
MLWILVLGLMAACAALFQRLYKAELRLEELELRQSDTDARLMDLALRGVKPPADTEVAVAEPPLPDEVEEEREFAVAAEPATPTVTLSTRSAEPEGEVVATREAAFEQEDEKVVEPTDFAARSFDLEEIFGHRLPIWVGGITLAVGGILGVLYSIEEGLLTPPVRVALAFLFGLVLLAGAEVAYRFRERVGDDRVRQALSGAGLSTLYAGFYLAGTQYGLIGQSFAFLGLAAVTALAIFVSFRFGLPSAILGLIGGFMAPLLVGGDEANLPLLSLYLALITSGLTYTGNRQGRPWLGLAALVAGLGWGFLLLMDGGMSSADIAAVGVYAIVLGAILPTMLVSKVHENPARLISAAVASIQLAILVESAGFGLLAWGLYLLLGAALAFFAWERPEMRVGNVMAGIIAVILLSLWPDFGTFEFSLIAAAIVMLFAGVPLLHLHRDRESLVEPAMAAGIPLAVGIVLLSQFGSLATDALQWPEALGLIALAGIPLYAARLLWSETRPFETVAALASGAILLFLAALCILPDWMTSLAAAAITLGLIAVMRPRLDASHAYGALAILFAVVTAISLVPSDGGWREMERLFTGSGVPDFISALRWIAAAAVFAALAIVDLAEKRRHAAEFFAALLGFATFAQLLPPIALVWLALASILALRWRLPTRETAMVALTICIALWALDPLFFWLEHGLEAFAGNPMMLSDLPSVREAAGFLLPLAIAIGAIPSVVRLAGDRTLALLPAAVLLVVITLHVFFKQVFAIDSMTDFRDLGLAERTAWQALLLGAAWLAARGVAGIGPNIRAATVLGSLALIHFAWFALLLHNPLYDAQAVGPAPLANLALLSGAIGIGALVSLRIWIPRFRVAFDGAIMVVALLTALTLLRQVFAGSILPPEPMTQAEDLLRSLVGIVMAIVFLLIGSRREERTWRVGSLVLMTAMVIKVFAFDTAGLEGLIRIASFVALGASLIGIGWFYSRQLKATPAAQ